MSSSEEFAYRQEVIRLALNLASMEFESRQDPDMDAMHDYLTEELDRAVHYLAVCIQNRQSTDGPYNTAHMDLSTGLLTDEISDKELIEFLWRRNPGFFSFSNPKDWAIYEMTARHEGGIEIKLERKR